MHREGSLGGGRLRRGYVSQRDTALCDIDANIAREISGHARIEAGVVTLRFDKKTNFSSSILTRIVLSLFSRYQMALPPLAV